MAKRGWKFWTVLAATAVAACGGGGDEENVPAGGTPPSDCVAGTLDCGCHRDACDPGLSCVAEICVPDGGGGSPSSGGGGTGATEIGGSDPGGSASGGGGTGGEERCTGTPTGSCGDVTCDLLPGCTVNEPSRCGGTATPCSRWDGDPDPCDAQWGCESLSGGACRQAVSSCRSADSDARECVRYRGCSFEGGNCVGDIADCTAWADTRNCGALGACSWEESDGEFCGGVAVACEDLGPADCAAQDGCVLEPATCRGAPTPCEELALEECGTQPGCTPAGTGGTGGVPGMLSRMPDVVVTELTARRTSLDNTPALYLYVEEVNRGTAIAPPHVNEAVLSVDDIIGNDDDEHLLTLDESFSLAGFALDPVYWGPDYYSMESIAENHASGYYYVGVVLDTGDEVTEAEEQNNAVLGPQVFIGSHSFDLAGADVTTDASGSLAPGDALTITTTILNSSTTEVDSLSVRLYLSDDATLDADDVAFCDAEATGTVAVGEEVLVAADCVVPRARGDYYVIAEVDPDDLVGDTDRTNNDVATADPISVAAPSPNLLVSDVFTVDASIDWQGAMDVTAQIENVGSDPADAHSVGLYLSPDDVLDDDDELLCSIPVAALASGGVAVVSDTCYAPESVAGDLWLIAAADPMDLVFETDETDNVAVANTPIAIAYPDWNLQAGPFWTNAITVIAGADGTPGTEVTFEVTVVNDGSQDIPSYRVGVYLSTDRTVTTDDELFCTHDSTDGYVGINTYQFTCNVPVDFPPGTYSAGVVLDPDDDVVELEEGDNISRYDGNEVEVIAP